MRHIYVIVYFFPFEGWSKAGLMDVSGLGEQRA